MNLLIYVTDLSVASQIHQGQRDFQFRSQSCCIGTPRYGYFLTDNGSRSSIQIQGFPRPSVFQVVVGSPLSPFTVTTLYEYSISGMRYQTLNLDQMYLLKSYFGILHDLI